MNILSCNFSNNSTPINNKVQQNIFTSSIKDLNTLRSDTFTFRGSIPITESTNPKSLNLKSTSPTEDIVGTINAENNKVAPAVEKENKKIAEAVDMITESFENGGKLYYFGAGTSGRLGVLDASECPPTYSVPKDMVNGVIAGGDTAIQNAVEGAEDNFEAGKKDAERLKENDTAVVVSASGNPQYLMGVIETAREKGVKLVGITCNPEAKITDKVDTCICPVVGPEIVAGSSRMKAGTAQKLVLNTLTTASMIKMGKFYKGKMIGVSTTNEKLHNRAVRMTSELTGAPESQAKEILEANGWQVPVACLILNHGLTPEDANKALQEHKGNLEKTINDLEGNSNE